MYDLLFLVTFFHSSIYPPNIYSFACLTLGIKCDAYLGRLNQGSVMINWKGTFHGQCSEICGILHSSVPINIEFVSIEKFFSWLLEQ